MKVAIIASNLIKISEEAKRGIEIFVESFVKELADRSTQNNIEITLFASGNTKLPVKVESIDNIASAEDSDIGKENYSMFEQALASKAFSKQAEFDLFHCNQGNSENIFPLFPFVNKPIVVTLHSILSTNYAEKFYSLYKDLKNVYFVSISNSQRIPMPNLNYIDNIYHGINTLEFNFEADGGETILWSGRGAPEKGLELAVNIVKKTNKKGIFCIVQKEKYLDWLKQIERNNERESTNFVFDLLRKDLISYYQKAKLFLFPIQWEEPFGLVMIESMACGTPVVAFARGSVPEVIKDGETGFIVNYSEEDKRGDFIIKQTGIEGLCEAVDRIYTMSPEEYKKMRLACRKQVEEKFTIEKMVERYEEVYKRVVNQKT